MSDVAQKLAELFTYLPGVGPRQARRFVSYILSRDEAYANELIKRVTEIKKEVGQCSECYRYFNHQGKFPTCSLCRDTGKDTKKLVIVEKDVDLDAVKKVEGMNCRYFVLGGLVPLTDRETPYVLTRKMIWRKLLSPCQLVLKVIILSIF
jgi:recombination protein RecR